jgi:RNA polymerase sigma-70 factor (ECF subfamily)
MKNLKNNLYYDELMNSFLNGNERDFYTIVRDWKDPVLNFFYQHLNNFEISEELTQEVFLKIWKTKKYKSSGAFYTWLYRVSYNRLLDYFRAKKIKSESFDEHSFYLETKVNDKPGLEQAVIQKDEIESVRKVINMLPHEHKTILVLSQLHEMQYKEIAEIMDCSVNSVKGKVFRAIKKFVHKYGEVMLNVI